MCALPSIVSHGPARLTQHCTFLITFRRIPMSIHLAMSPPLCISVDMLSSPVLAFNLRPRSTSSFVSGEGQDQANRRACRARAQRQRLTTQSRECYCVYDPVRSSSSAARFRRCAAMAILHSQRTDTVRPPAVCRLKGV